MRSAPAASEPAAEDVESQPDWPPHPNHAYHIRHAPYPSLATTSSVSAPTSHRFGVKYRRPSRVSHSLSERPMRPSSAPIRSAPAVADSADGTHRAVTVAVTTTTPVEI